MVLFAAERRIKYKYNKPLFEIDVFYHKSIVFFLFSVELSDLCKSKSNSCVVFGHPSPRIRHSRGYVLMKWCVSGHEARNYSSGVKTAPPIKSHTRLLYVFMQGVHGQSLTRVMRETKKWW